MPDLEIRELTYKLMHRPSMSPEDRAKMSLKVLKESGKYSPMPFDFNKHPSERRRVIYELRRTRRRRRQNLAKPQTNGHRDAFSTLHSIV